MKISEVSAQTGLSIDTLRFYEKIGLIDPPARDGGGHRVYEASVLGWIRFLMKLSATGMKQADRIRYAQLRSEGDATIPERRRMLEDQRAALKLQLADLQETLEMMDQKVETYRKMEAEMQNV